MRRRLRPLLVTALALGAVAAAVPTADAGTYTVWACADGAGKPLPVPDWTAGTHSSNASATTTCGTAGAGGVAGNLQAISGAGPNQADTSIGAYWSLAAAAGTKIDALDLWWQNQASVQAPGRIQLYTDPGSAWLRDTGTFGSAAVPYSESNHQSFANLATSTITLAAWCTFSCAQPSRSISAFFQLYRAQLTVRDDTPPTGDVSGLTDGQTVNGPIAILARARDTGGGVRDLELRVNDAVVDARHAGGQCADVDPTTGDGRDYAVMHPCVAELPQAQDPPAGFSITPDMITADPTTVSIVARDAAGNTATLASASVRVAPALRDGLSPSSRYDAARDVFFNPDADTSSAGRPNGINAGPANVILSFVVKHHRRLRGRLRTVASFTRTRTVRYGTAARLRGRLTTPTGAPIVGARVYRAVSVAGGPWRLLPTPLVTSKTGRVSVRLDGSSPSRRLMLVYFPTTDSNASSRSRARLLRVRAPVRLALSRHRVRRGTRVSVTASVRRGIRPGASVIAALQLRQGRSWRTIRQLRLTARSHGRTRTALRLKTPSVYRLRLRVSSQPGLRYATGVSAPTLLRVR